MRHLILLTLLLTSASAYSYDESVNFQPGLNLYHEAASLTDLISAHGSQLCAPVSITHGMTYLKYASGYEKLKPVPDMDRDGTADTYKDKIRYFFKTCQSDINTGTHYHEAQDCMQSYIQQSGYKAWSYIVGPHAVNAPAGSSLADFKHKVRVEDIRAYVSRGYMVLMAIGWYQFNAVTNNYTRIGGHFFNVYGYDYNKSWGEDRMTLKVVNSQVDYGDRAPSQMFDSVEMIAVAQDGTQYPAETPFEITGPGFNFVQKTLVEDIFIAVPAQ